MARLSQLNGKILYFPDNNSHRYTMFSDGSLWRKRAEGVADLTMEFRYHRRYSFVMSKAFPPTKAMMAKSIARSFIYLAHKENL